MRTRIALVLALLGGFGLLASPAQARAVPEAWVPKSPTLTLVSQGFGHGIGMSQWGAEYRAEAGQTLDQVLGFYYPGTTRGSSAGLVRVWITEDGDHNTIVRPAKGLKLYDLGNGKAHTLPTSVGATAWRLTFVSGRTRVAYLKKGVWHYYRPGGRLLTGSGEFRSSANLLNLYFAGANHPYRGAMRLVGGRTVNVLSLDNYLRGVVPAEAYTTWKPVALQAQAVAARTYAAFERAENLTRSYQICDTTACQVYQGYAAEVASTNAAVAATAGRVVLYAGKPAFTQFSSSNGGYTAAGGKPYLVSKPDPFDTAYRNRTLSIGPNTIAKIEKAYPALGTFTAIRVLSKGTDGRVIQVEIDGSSPGTVTVAGSTFRSLVGARSTLFDFTNSPPA
ncbi:MAG: SpoIID/LytB domain-containing protein [Marmoricola sp.]